MFATLLTAAILGQCANGRCGPPARFLPPVQFVAPAVQAAPPIVRVLVTCPHCGKECMPAAGATSAICYACRKPFEVKVTATSGEKATKAVRCECGRSDCIPAQCKCNGCDHKAKTEPAELPGHSTTIGANFGINLSQLAHGEKITSRGPSAHAFVQQAMSPQTAPVGADLTDDSTKPYLTILGPEADRSAVKRDLSGPLADVASKYHVHDYAPEDPMASSVGLPASGKPTILEQAADGTARHLQNDYQDGAAGLVGALRKVNPNFDPSKVVDARKAFSIPDPTDFLKANWAWLVIAGCALILLNSRKPTP